MRHLAIASTLWLLAASPALAGAVTGLGSTDGYGATPTPGGLVVVDTQVSALPGGSLAVPILSVAAGVNDGIEFGVGSSLDVAGFGTSTRRTSVEAVYPWMRASLPFETDTLRTALMIGALVPAYNSSTELTPGMSLLADEAIGALTAGMNLGYAQGLTTGTNLTTLNVHFSLPVAAATCYEEQFYDYPVGGFGTAGVRASLIVPVLDRWSFNLTPAVLWGPSGTTRSWSFAPSAGITSTF